MEYIPAHVGEYLAAVAVGVWGSAVEQQAMLGRLSKTQLLWGSKRV